MNVPTHKIKIYIYITYKHTHKWMCIGSRTVCKILSLIFSSNILVACTYALPRQLIRSESITIKRHIACSIRILSYLDVTANNKPFENILSKIINLINPLNNLFIIIYYHIIYHELSISSKIIFKNVA